MNPTSDDKAERPLRQQALARIKKKREFLGHALTYVLVNAMLIAVWAVSSDRGTFWPIYVIGGWGIGLVCHAWGVHHGEPSEEEIRREMQRLS